MESERTEEYLEAIYKRRGKEMLVSTSSLAKDLKVSQPAVTDMLRHLERKGLIEYEVGKGATLTEAGADQAVKVIRRHRLWERFLTDILGLKWDKVHKEACRLEHVTSPDIEDRLADLLGDVDTCPHGQFIPDKSGRLKDEELIPLSQIKPSQEVCIQAINREDSKLLQEIEKLGLRPRTCVKVLEKGKNGLLKLEINERSANLSNKIASVILTKPIYKKELAGDEEQIPLSMLAAGHSGIIRSCSGACGALGRCLSLGFTPGSPIKMLENFNNGPVLVKVRDTEVAIGRGLAEKIAISRDE